MNKTKRKNSFPKKIPFIVFPDEKVVHYWSTIDFYTLDDLQRHRYFIKVTQAKPKE